VTVTGFHATLGMGEWLALTQQGLAPCKKRQACLAHQRTSLSDVAMLLLSI